jgi:hypothetical protein
MERPPKLMHNDGSCTIEGDGAGEYLKHDWDHKKGHGEDEEHTEAYGHEDLHNVPHNESPINKYVDTAFPGLRGAVSEHKEHAAKSIAPGQVKPIGSIPKKGKEWTSPM